MATRFRAERKLTSRYVPAYSYLDEWDVQDFFIKEVRGRVVYGKDWDSGYTQWIYLTTSRPVTRDEMRDALSIYSRGCACEHDCCGHYFGGACDGELKPMRRLRTGRSRRWAVPLHYSPNV